MPPSGIATLSLPCSVSLLNQETCSCSVWSCCSCSCLTSLERGEPPSTHACNLQEILSFSDDRIPCSHFQKHAASNHYACSWFRSSCVWGAHLASMRLKCWHQNGDPIWSVGLLRLEMSDKLLLLVPLYKQTDTSDTTAHLRLLIESCFVCHQMIDLLVVSLVH